MTKRYLNRRPSGIPAHTIIPTDLHPHLDCTLVAPEGFTVLHNWVVTFETMDGEHVACEMVYNPTKSPVRTWRRLAQEVEQGRSMVFGCDAPMAAMVSIEHRAKVVAL